MALTDWFKRSKKEEKQEVTTSVAEQKIIPPSSDAEKRLSTLSRKEKQTFCFLMEGLTMKQVAEKMGVKYPTVNSHTTAIYRKLGVNSRVQLLVQYGEYKNFE